MANISYICENKKELYYVYTHFYNKEEYINTTKNFTMYGITDIADELFPIIVEIDDKIKLVVRS